MERDRNLWSSEQRFQFATEDFNLNAGEVLARPPVREVGIDEVAVHHEACLGLQRVPGPKHLSHGLHAFNF